MAKKQETETMELTVEGLMAAGYTQEDAENIVGSNEGSGGGLPFPILKINYDAEIPDFAKKGEFVADIVKDDDGEVTSLTNFGTTINIVAISSGCQYSRYNASTNKADISSNIFPMSATKQAYDLKTGKKIADLKKNDPDNKIKFQELMLVLASSDAHPEPKPYIMFVKGAFLYSLNQCRKPLPNRGNVMSTLSFTLKMLKNGATKYFVVDEDSFMATPRSIEEIKEGATTLPAYIKTFNDWVGSVNSGGDAKEPKTTAVVEDDEDEIEF